MIAYANLPCGIVATLQRCKSLVNVAYWRRGLDACQDEGVTDDMAEVLEAHKAYLDAPEEARELIARRRAQLGLAVVQERGRGTTQGKIAERLGRTREQVRRYQQAYDDWLRDHPDQPLDAAAV